MIPFKINGQNVQAVTGREATNLFKGADYSVRILAGGTLIESKIVLKK